MSPREGTTRDPAADPELVARARSICLALPEAYEERAWVGTRWRIRLRTFAHVVTIEDGWPPAHARAAEATAEQGRLSVVTFRSSGEELAALAALGHPYYQPQRAPGVVLLRLGDADAEGPGWDEIAELLVESYRLLAPQKLVRRADAEAAGRMRGIPDGYPTSTDAD